MQPLALRSADVSNLKQFKRIMRVFSRIGLNVLGANPYKKCPATAWKGLAVPGCPRVDPERVAASMWPSEHGPLGGFLFPSSAAPGHTPLVVVDVDNEASLAPALELFGESPLTVRTRRGFHLYYRAPGFDVEVKTRNAILGEPGIDIKAWRGGVMAPGSPHIKGGEYVPSVPLEAIDAALVAALPVFDVERYEAAWQENRPKKEKRIIANARKRPDIYRTVKAKPKFVGELKYMGTIRGDIKVTLEETQKEVMLYEAEGEKIYAIDRPDQHASGQVWRNANKQLFYTDWSDEVMWRILDPNAEVPFYEKVKRTPPGPGKKSELDPEFDPDPDPDPEPDSLEIVSQLRKAGIDTIDLPTDGYLDIDVDEGVTFVRAPHGVGKTELARRLLDPAQRAISVANTRLLVTANATRFNIPSHLTEDSTDAPKVSTTINSLCRFKVDDALDIFHVDEADQVHRFTHSGLVVDAKKCFQRMMDLCASAKRTVITSADLDTSDIEVFANDIRRRDPDKPVRVFVRAPKKRETEIRLVQLATVKAEIYAALREWRPGDPAHVVLCTNRNLPSRIAYGAADDFPHARPFWASSENSRFHETMRIFEGDFEADGKGLFESTGLFTMSPVAPSGVSFEHPVDTVFFIHDKRELEIETCVQMVLRFRNAKRIVWGVTEWTPTNVDYDRDTVLAVIEGMKNAQIEMLAGQLPTDDVRKESVVTIDPGFLESFVATVQRRGRSYEDPIGRIHEIAKEHRLNLKDELSLPPRNSAPEFRSFQNMLQNGDQSRTALDGFETNRARKPSKSEAKRIKDQARYYKNEQQQKQRYDLEEYYGEEMSIELYEEDKGGQLRRRCENYLDVLGVIEDHERGVEDSPFAWRCWNYNRGKQPVEYSHRYLRAYCVAALLKCIGVDLREPEVYSNEELRKGAESFLDQMGPMFAQCFPRSKLTDPDRIVAWALRILVKYGAATTGRGKGRPRDYEISFEYVHQMSQHQYKKRIQAFKEAKEKKNWANFIDHVRKHK